MKRIVALILVMAFAFACVPAYAAEQNPGISVVIDGQKLNMADANGNTLLPVIQDGTTYLPVRAVAEAFGLNVDWDNDTRTVVIGTKGEAVLGSQINITIDGRIFTAKDVNGNVVYPMNINGSVYIPIRAIAEAFGKDVSWDQATMTAGITTPDDISAAEAVVERLLTSIEAGDLESAGAYIAGGDDLLGSIIDSISLSGDMADVYAEIVGMFGDNIWAQIIEALLPKLAGMVTYDINYAAKDAANPSRVNISIAANIPVIDENSVNNIDYEACFMEGFGVQSYDELVLKFLEKKNFGLDYLFGDFDEMDILEDILEAFKDEFVNYTGLIIDQMLENAAYEQMDVSLTLEKVNGRWIITNCQGLE